MELATRPEIIAFVTHGTVVSYETPLEEIAREIETRSDDGDVKLLETAKLVAQLKTRIEAGEAGCGVRWLEWTNVRFKRRRSQLYKLVTIGSAPDPRQALAEFRLNENLRQKKRRMNIAERDPERVAVIKLIRSMDIGHVRKIRRYICVLTGE